jgi:hypothetical protein
MLPTMKIQNGAQIQDGRQKIQPNSNNFKEIENKITSFKR